MTSTTNTRTISFADKKNKPSIDIVFLGLYFVLLPISTALSGIIGSSSLVNYLSVLYCFFAFFRLLIGNRIVFRKRCFFVYLYLTYVLFSFVWNRFFVFNWYFFTFTLSFLIVMLSSLFDYTDSDYVYLNKCVTVSFAVTILTFLFNINHLYGGRIQVAITSTMDPNDFGGGMMLILSFLLVQLSKTKKYILIIPICFVGFMIVLTGSRAALLMFIIAILARFMLTGGIKNVIKALVAVLVLVLLFVLIERFLPPEIVERLSLSRLMEDQGSGRVGIWKAAFARFGTFNLLEMLFGTGHGSFAQTVNYYAGYRDTPYMAHNMYVNELIEGGIIGELLLICCIISLIRNAHLNKNMLGILVIICFAFEGISLDIQSYRVLSVAFFFAMLPNRDRGKLVI